MNDYEHQHQSALVQWVDRAKCKYKELDLLFAIPNGGQRHIKVAIKLKREGVRAGVPDLHLPIPKNGWSGLWIEMKSPKGTLTDTQKEWHKKLSEANHKVVVCRSSQEAIKEICEYLGII